MIDAPAFDFYPERWLAGVAMFSDSEQLAYLRLLCHQWILGGLPDDLVKLRRLAGKGVTLALLDKFPLGADSQRRNPRLEWVRAEQRTRIAARRLGAAYTHARLYGVETLCVQERELLVTAGKLVGGKLVDAKSKRGKFSFGKIAVQSIAQRYYNGSTEITHYGTEEQGLQTSAEAAQSHNEQSLEMPFQTSAAQTSEVTAPLEAESRAQWPALDQAVAFGESQLLARDEVELWWLAREASGWMRSSLGGMVRVGNWQADCKSYCLSARGRRRSRSPNHGFELPLSSHAGMDATSVRPF
jgi:hypothetical protein